MFFNANQKTMNQRNPSEVKQIDTDKAYDDDVLNIDPSSEDIESYLLGSLTLDSNSPGRGVMYHNRLGDNEIHRSSPRRLNELPK